MIRSTLSINEQNTLPHDYGIGFCDLGVIPGNRSDVFSKEELSEWRSDLFNRLRKHLQRVCKESHDDPKVRVKSGCSYSALLFVMLLMLYCSQERSSML